jgi:hypothetical protein
LRTACREARSHVGQAQQTVERVVKQMIHVDAILLLNAHKGGSNRTSRRSIALSSNGYWNCTWTWLTLERAGWDFDRGESEMTKIDPVIELVKARLGDAKPTAEMVLQIMESLEHEGLIVDTGLRRGRYIVYAAASEGKQQEVT